MIHFHISENFKPVSAISEGIISSLKLLAAILSPTKKNEYENEHKTQALLIS